MPEHLQCIESQFQTLFFQYRTHVQDQLFACQLREPLDQFGLGMLFIPNNDATLINGVVHDECLVGPCAVPQGVTLGIGVVAQMKIEQWHKLR